MKKCYIFTISLLSIFFVLSSQAQLREKPTLEHPEIATERLSRYDRFLEKEVSDKNIAGAISLVYRKGKTVHDKTFGYGSLDAKSPMKKDGIFHIMSMTKPIVSVAFMMLYEEGHFMLSDPVSKYLPQFNEMQVSVDPSSGKDGPTETAKTEITIAQLLSHTAGFSHGLGGAKLDQEIAKALYYEPQETIESRVNTLLEFPLVGHPGEQWYYSASPDVLALLIEHFSQMSLAEFLQERIFDPLGMADTGYNIPKEKQHRWVPVHNKDTEGILGNSEQQLPLTGNTVFGGTHGLFSTASDYMVFCKMLLNRGSWKGTRLLSPKTLEIMVMNQVGDLYEAPGQGFGLGFGILTDLADSKSTGSVGQYYWSGAYCTYFFVDPKEELIAILMTQVQPYTNYYGQKMRQFIYQALMDQ